MSIVEELEELIEKRGGSTAGIQTISDAIVAIFSLEEEAIDECKQSLNSILKFHSYDTTSKTLKLISASL